MHSTTTEPTRNNLQSGLILASLLGPFMSPLVKMGPRVPRVSRGKSGKRFFFLTAL